MVSKPTTPETPALDFMTLREFSDRTGISLTVIYEQAKDNELPVPVKKIGRQYRISRHAYDRWREREFGESENG